MPIAAKPLEVSGCTVPTFENLSQSRYIDAYTSIFKQKLCTKSFQHMLRLTEFLPSSKTHIFLHPDMICFFSRMRWGGVGWGNKSARVPNVLPRYSDTSYYATAHSLALAQTRLTTLLLVLLHLHRHVTYYVIAGSLALAQTRHAMLLHVPLLLRQCNHSKGTWCLQSRVGQRGTMSVHTGVVDTWWKLMKDSIPNNLVSTSGTKAKKKIIENLSFCPLFSMAMGKPRDLLKVTAKYLKEIS